MEVFQQKFSQVDIHAASKHLGGQWLSVTSDDMPNGLLAWDKVLVNTSVGILEITAHTQVRSFEGASDDYACLTLRSSDGTHTTMTSTRSSLFHGRGETVKSIWVLRDFLTAAQIDGESYQYVADVGLAFELSTQWIAISLASHRTEAICVSRAPTKSELELPHLEDRWTSTTLERFDYRREWILLNLEGVGQPGNE